MEIRPALAPYVPLARMLAQTFGQDCEVVLHDLDCPEHSVVHVAVSYTHLTLPTT